MIGNFDLIDMKNSNYKVSEVKLSYETNLQQGEKIKITSSEDAYKVCLSNWDVSQLEYRESFKIILLNQANIVLGIHKISEGGIAETTVDVRLILQAAILSNASAIILVHNHPSGNIIPSRADKQITSKIEEAAKTMEIKVFDHLIIIKNDYFSFADEGHM